MNTAAELAGFADWQQALGRFSASADDRIAKMMAMAAETVADDAQRLVPRGATGAAKASLRAMGAAVTIGGSRAPYGPWLEFGGNVGRHESVHRPFVPGGRYIWPTWMKNRTDLLTAWEKAMGDLAGEAGL